MENVIDLTTGQIQNGRRYFQYNWSSTLRKTLFSIELVKDITEDIIVPTSGQVQNGGDY
jgi:hypothetical protein